jgi:hypothetical protein
MPRIRTCDVANVIRARETPNDKYYTPESLVRIHLEKFRGMTNLRIYEPFAGKNAYFNLFPEYFQNCIYERTEIDDGLDFFDYCGTPDVIVSNPPFSIIDAVFERCFKLKPQLISFIMSQSAVTPCRLKWFNDNGYHVWDYHLTKVNRWFGVSVILTLSRDRCANIISFDVQKHLLVKSD